MDESSALLASLPARLAPHFREGAWEAEICLPVWPRIFKFDLPDGWVSVYSGVAGQEALDGSQVELLGRLIAEQQSIGRAVRDAILQVLPKMRARFEPVGMGPVPNSPAEVFDTTMVVSIHAHGSDEGTASLGVQLHCDWDEHGIGVLWRDATVLGVSDADVAIYGELNFLYPLDSPS